MGAEVLVPLLLTGLSAGTQYVNSRNTARRTDNALAAQIRNQGRKQQQIDTKVNDEVAELEKSRAEEHRAESLESYMDTLLRGRDKLDDGLTPNIGSDVFRADSAKAAQDVQAQAGDRAGLMARIDAPTMQRQEEGFGYGNLATDISLLAREAAGQDYLDQLRVRRASERNAGLDALSALLQGGAGAAGGMASGAAAKKAGLGIANQFFANGGAGGIGY